MSRRRSSRGRFLAPITIVAALAGSAAPAPAVPTCDALVVVGDGNRLFADGFETGDDQRWGPGGPPGGPVLFASETLEARFELTLGGDLSGEHTVDFRVVLPDGFRYQTLTVPFAGAAAASAPRDAAAQATAATPLRRLAGYPDPLPLQTVRVPAAGAASPVTATLPVGGTAITAGSLYGGWTVEAYLDGADTPCAAATFEVRR